MTYFEEENCNLGAALVSLKDYPGEGEEEEEGKRKNRYGGRLSALSSCLAPPHCKHGRVKLEAVCRQRAALLRWYFVMQVVAMVTAEGGSHRLGDAMGIFLSTIPQLTLRLNFTACCPLCAALPAAEPSHVNKHSHARRRCAPRTRR